MKILKSKVQCVSMLIFLSLNAVSAQTIEPRFDEYMNADGQTQAVLTDMF